MMEGKALSPWTQRSFQPLPMTLPVGNIPFVSEQRQLRHRVNGLIEITRRIPSKGNFIADLRCLATNVDDRPMAHPFLVVDFDGIVANRQNQIRPIGECFHVGAPRPTYNTGPILMAFREKTLRVERRNERNLLPFNELKELCCIFAPGKSEPSDDQGSAGDSQGR